MSCCNSHNNNDSKYSNFQNTDKKSGGCGCGHSDGGCCKTNTMTDIQLDFDSLSTNEKDFLNKLTSVQYLPLTQFVVKSTKEHDFSSIALSTVYLEDINETLEQIKNTKNMLESLSDKGFISLDYDIELENCDYNEYFSSDIFDYFKQTVLEGATKENYLGDIADIYKGSIAPTTQYLLTIDDSDIFTSNVL